MQSVDTAGAGGETRTPNIQIRSLTLYPVELRPQTEKRRQDFIGYFVGRRRNWGERRGLNPRPLESQSRALPTELRPPISFNKFSTGIYASLLSFSCHPINIRSSQADVYSCNISSLFSYLQVLLLFFSSFDGSLEPVNLPIMCH